MRRVPTFGELADELFLLKRPGWRREAHAQQWQSSVARYTPAIRDLPIDKIGIVEVLGVLRSLWKALPETASRVRGRIEMILDYAKARGLRSGENPAAWKGGLAHLLPRRPKLAKTHFAAMPYSDVPGFMAGLRAQAGVAPRALEFLILTAARRGEVLGACAEIDLDQKIWSCHRRERRRAPDIASRWASEPARSSQSLPARDLGWSSRDGVAGRCPFGN